MAASQKGQNTHSVSRAEKARKIADKYSGAGLSFHVKYLGTQEVSSAKGDAVVADCLKELRSLFQDMATHLPKVTVTLQFSGITVQDEKSQLETLKAPLDHISYVCLDPADSSIFSFIIRSPDTISSKGLRLHAFMTDPQTAITFNRSARELFDFVARMMRAKKKLAQQQVAVPSVDTQGQSSGTKTQKEPLHDEPVPVLAPPPPAPQRPSPKSASPPPEPQAQPQPPDNTALEENIHQVPTSSSASATAQSEEEKIQAVFDEWKVLDKELSNIAEDLGIGPLEPAVPVPSSSQPPVFPTYDPLMANPTSAPPPPPSEQPTPFDVLTTSSGADPFDSSFFDLSFSDTQPTTTATAETAPSSHGPQIFNNPVFNGHTDNPSEPSIPPPLTSTPESKREVYASRPRPKGRLSTDNIVPLPSVPAEPTTQQNREVSLSPTGEEQVLSILSNTDPFQPPTLEPFQSPPVANGGSFFQLPPLTHNTSNPSFFSPSSATPQGSIQVANPLYQSYSFDSSFSAPFGSPTLPIQPPVMPPGPVVQGGMQMQPQFPVISPPPLPAMQPVPMAQPQSPQAAIFAVQGTQLPPTGMVPPGGMLSPTAVSSPPPVSPNLGSVPGPTKTRSSGSYPFKPREETDSMFADLIPAGTLSPEKPSTKKAEFVKPVKAPMPSLAELQETKLKWTAFKGSEQVAEAGSKSQDSGPKEWPASPFDDEHSSTEPNLGEALGPLDTILEAEKVPMQPSAAEDQQVPDSTGKKAQPEPDTEANTLLDFEAAFQEAGNKEYNIDSAFEVKFDSKPKSQPPPTAATNDPFTTSNSSAAPSEKEPSGPWISF